MFPLLEKDIGDAWVRAASSDPIKTSSFLSLRRGFEECVNSGNCPHQSSKTNAQGIHI